MPSKNLIYKLTSLILISALFLFLTNQANALETRSLEKGFLSGKEKVMSLNEIAGVNRGMLAGRETLLLAVSTDRPLGAVAGARTNSSFSIGSLLQIIFSVLLGLTAISVIYMASYNYQTRKEYQEKG